METAPTVGTLIKVHLLEIVYFNVNYSEAWVTFTLSQLCLSQWFLLVYL